MAFPTLDRFVTALHSAVRSTTFRTLLASVLAAPILARSAAASPVAASTSTWISPLLAIPTPPPPAAAVAQPGAIIPLTPAEFTDGPFVFVPNTPGSTTMTIPLADAVTGNWRTTSGLRASDNRAVGVYDPEIWAVVFKFTSMHLVSDRFVKFTNHPSGAPVVFLVDGNVTLDGGNSMDVSGDSVTPGPGGFYGGWAQGPFQSHGRGPGGGNWSSYDDADGAYAGTLPSPGGTTYGSQAILPFIGGSGGARSSDGTPGGGGAGAILIASNGTISMGNFARILANSIGSGRNDGAGGAIRLVANTLSASSGARLEVTGTSYGRILMEANSFPGLPQTFPSLYQTSIRAPTEVLPDPQTAPSVRVLSVTRGAETHSVPVDPRPSFNPPLADVTMSGSGAATVLVEARFVNPGQVVHVRVTPHQNPSAVYTGTLTGTFALSTATVNVTLPVGVCAIQARAEL